jgi:biopolymer transport protein ExbD
MMCIRSVCFVAAAAIVGVAAQMSVRSQNSPETPAMQKGISVQMAVSNFAAPMPAADDSDAWIVTVTNDGRMFFGVDPVSAENLADEMKRHPRDRKQMLYIKSDARASFSEVERVVEAASDAGFEAPILLTSQAETSRPGVIVPPEGLEVWSDSPSSDSQSTTVRVLATKQSALALRVNDEEVPWSALQSKLDQLFQDRHGKTVLLEADGKLQFGQVVHVIDVCHSAGARLMLSRPTL